MVVGSLSEISAHQPWFAKHGSHGSDRHPIVLKLPQQHSSLGQRARYAIDEVPIEACTRSAGLSGRGEDGGGHGAGGGVEAAVHETAAIGVTPQAISKATAMEEKAAHDVVAWVEVQPPVHLSVGVLELGKVERCQAYRSHAANLGCKEHNATPGVGNSSHAEPILRRYSLATRRAVLLTGS